MANGDVHPALAFGVWGVGARMARVLLCMGGAIVLGLNAASAETSSELNGIAPGAVVIGFDIDAATR